MHQFECILPHHDRCLDDDVHCLYEERPVSEIEETHVVQAVYQEAPQYHRREVDGQSDTVGDVGQ